MLDHAGEAKLGKLQIGTTRRGIGPCYADKAARLGIRVQDLLDEKILKKKIVAALEPKRLSLRPFAKDPQLDLQTITEEYLTYGHRLAPYIADTVRLVHEQLDAGPHSGVRGGAGRAARHRPRHLSVRHLVQPGGGRGVRRGRRRAPRTSTRCWGVMKAYGTRVGAGPVPDRARRRPGRRDPRARRRVRHHDRPGQASRLARPGGAPLRGADQLAHRAGGHEARRALGLRPAVRVHALPRPRGRRVRATSPTTRPCCITPPASTSSWPAGART